MKSRATRRVVVLSLGFGVGLFILANSGPGQSPSSNPKDDPFYNRAQTDSSGSNSQDRKTIYDKSGTAATPGANVFGGPAKERTIYGNKKQETMVVTESSKPVEMKKTKFGSSDTSEETGVFKGSLLDSGLSRLPKSNVPSGDAKPTSSATLGDSRFVSPQSNPTPQATAAATASGKKIDITLGVSPVPSATAMPRP